MDIIPKETYRCSKDMKRCSTSLIIREMQGKITVRHHLIPVRTVILKKPQITNGGEDVEKLKS